MRLEKLEGFERIYQAECFPSDVEAMFGKNKGEQKRYLYWLRTWLKVLDTQGMNALYLQQFEHLQNTDNPHLYAIRHPRSKINERYIYAYADGEAAILLTAFMEKSKDDYKPAILRATRIYSELEDNENDNQ